MVPEVRPLEAILDQLIQVFDRLTILLEEERKALKDHDAAQIAQLSRQIDEAWKAVGQLDGVRQQHTTTLASQTGLVASPSAPITLEALAGVLPSSRLPDLRQTLRERIATVDQHNRENQAIFRGVRFAIEALLRAYQESTSKQVSYNRLGRRQTSGKVHLFSKQL
jgi:flagellar biosynthesis/type III secretory pathway chaperone